MHYCTWEYNFVTLTTYNHKLISPWGSWDIPLEKLRALQADTNGRVAGEAGTSISLFSVWILDLGRDCKERRKKKIASTLLIFSYVSISFYFPTINSPTNPKSKHNLGEQDTSYEIKNRELKSYWLQKSRIIIFSTNIKKST